MNEREIEQIVRHVMAAIANEGEPPILPVQSNTSEEPISDITAEELREQYLVEDPLDRDAFMALKRMTPARVGVGHSGARYRTATMLRFQADQAAAQSTVFTDVSEAFLTEMGLATYTTLCDSRDEFLTRPDKGRKFTQDTLRQIARDVSGPVQVLLYLSDGLSSGAVEANAPDILPVISRGLEGYGIRSNKPFFVKYGRVATQDQLGEAIGADVVCVLLGERPGLVSANSMSAYITYKPTVGMPESRRTVLANIRKGGTPCVEAGAHIVDLIRMMLEKKRSGLELQV
ncbi:MAG: ethanolamine ammonia-lyase subunit EutC [Clostridia bacterium]|nr:ethanolamine ammonia-lyase subunit EutC [Clostridia bacterium]